MSEFMEDVFNVIEELQAESKRMTETELEDCANEMAESQFALETMTDDEKHLLDIADDHYNDLDNYGS